MAEPHAIFARTTTSITAKLREKTMEPNSQNEKGLLEEMVSHITMMEN